MIADLNSFENLAYYSAHFMDTIIWEPYVREVCRENGFSCGSVMPGVAGTYPTFIVSPKRYGSIRGNVTFIVKFYGPVFDGEAAFSTELAIGRWLEEQSLPVPSPAILAEGRIDERWRYLVFEYIPGNSVNQARSELTQEDLRLIARQMGETLRTLHTHSLPSGNRPQPGESTSKKGFLQFLREQQEQCSPSHHAWSDLPTHLLEEVESFLLPVEALVDLSHPLHFIHADLTGDHLLGRTESGKWHSLAIIDWGDARQGNILYELVALHLDLFKGDRLLLQECLNSYDLPDFYRQDFSRKAFSVTLMHQFPIPGSVRKQHETAPSLEEMAEGIFGL